MRKRFLALIVVLPGLLFVPLAASAANSPGQIVNCAGTAPWCFRPDPIQISVGATVTWTNTTGSTHTATSDTGAWNTGNIAAGGTSGAIAFPAAGTFPYHCAIHPSMTGTVIVSAAAVVPSSPPVRGLASGGGGPPLPVVAALLLLGLGLLSRRVLRPGRGRASRLEPSDGVPPE